MAAHDLRPDRSLPAGLAAGAGAGAGAHAHARAAVVAGARRHLVDQSWDNREVVQEIVRQLLLVSGRR